MAETAHAISRQVLGIPPEEEMDADALQARIQLTDDDLRKLSRAAKIVSEMSTMEIFYEFLTTTSNCNAIIKEYHELHQKLEKLLEYDIEI